MACRYAQGAEQIETTPVDNLFLTEYMGRANGDHVRVYLYGLMQCMFPSMGDISIAEALNLSEQDVLDAFSYWQEQGLVQITSAEPLVVEYKSLRQRIPGEASTLPGKYHTLIQSIQKAVAPRQLKPTEIKRIYDWIEVFGLPEDVIEMLVVHCLEIKGQRVSLKYMDEVAKTWADERVQSKEDAAEHIQAHRELLSGATAILKRWRVGRNATRDELDLYEKWTKGWGFSDEAVLAACVAVTKAGTPSFQYLNGVLEGMRQEGAKTREDVQRLLANQDNNATLAKHVFARAGISRAAKLTEREELAMFVNEWHVSLELLLLAAEYAKDAREPYGYLKRLICNWHQKGITTVAMAQQCQQERQEVLEQKTNQTRKKAGQDYLEHTYTNDELKHIAVDLDTDL